MNASQAKILIVDDSPLLRRQLRELMEGLGVLSIDEAGDGRAALERFRSSHFDLVISDWNMPFMSGIQLVRSIRKEPVRQQTPVLLTTADGSFKRTVEALEAGANGFLERPFPPQKLCQKVLRLLAPLTGATSVSCARRRADARTVEYRPDLLAS